MGRWKLFANRKALLMAAAAAALAAGFGTSAEAFSFNWQPQAAQPAPR